MSFVRREIGIAQQVKQDQKLRALARHDGTQTSLRLDNTTWTAIDLLARERGIRWQEWATEALEAAPDTINMAGELRQASMTQLLDRLGASPEVTISGTHQVLGRRYERLGDQGLADTLKDASIVHQDGAFGAFRLTVGHLDDGRQTAFICIESRLSGDQHLLITPSRK
jgi:predicted DNA-binding ribbon-helix-helix protein